MWTSIYSLLLTLLFRGTISINDGQQDMNEDSRNITFLPPISNYALVGHVIANKTVDSQDQCQIECFFIPECTSLNFDPTPHASPNCQLSASDKEIQRGDLTSMPGYIYQGSKNDCFKNACNETANRVCQPGFGPRGFRCICSKCFTGNDCQTYTRDTVLHFPRQATDLHAEKYVVFGGAALSNFTITLWLQIDGSASGSPVAFSFENTGNQDEIALFFNKPKLRIDFQAITSSQDFNGTKVFDGRWHHIALSWSQSSKAVNIYIDGIEENPITSPQFGENALNANLRFALGQEQDRYSDGGYDSTQSFLGNITAFNMWDRVFPDNEISKLAKECPSNRQGNLMNWTDIVQRKSDALKHFCGLTCEDFGLNSLKKPTRACFDNH